MTHRIELELTDREVDQLRIVMDALPLRPFGALILAVQKQLPMTEADVSSPLAQDLAALLRNRVTA